MTDTPLIAGSPRPDRTILVVDDDATVRTYHQVVLERDGYEVVAAENGSEALAAMETRLVDLLLLDSRMPGRSGLDVLSEIRATHPELPVMMVTAANGREDRLAGFERGADDYVDKPVDPAVLRARIRALFRSRQAALDARVRSADRRDRAEVGSVIEAGAFHPVFQPITSLRDGRVVAYEALTRFDDGCRPDVRFATASRVGLDAELAVATIETALRDARHLPPGTALHLNVAPRLLGHPPLRALLTGTGARRVVVELTEHEPIDDYGRVRTALAGLAGIGLAVDDAGAGYASMTHILALGPDEVKLDRQWVQGVDLDPARRALVSGLVSFAEATGTVLVAEGVESAAEAETLTVLGVHHAQGWHFGRPERVRAASA